MKKRILACLCALLLCLGLAGASVTLGVGDTPCFMAVNDNLLALEDRYIPIVINGQYYVPYTVLDRSATGLELGIFPIYNSMENTLTIYNREQVLIFYLSTGVCTDRAGNTLYARAVTRNGRVYVPARFTSEYFGLTYSYKSTAHGPLVRIRSASSFTDDNNFVGLAQQMMEDRLQEWRRKQTADDIILAPVPSPSPSPTPTITIDPRPTPSPDAGESERDRSGVRVYLALRADRTDGLAEQLEQLEQAGVKALFFFPAEGLTGCDETVRTVLCAGHAVGLLADGAAAEEVAAQTAEGNRVLAQIAHLDACTVLAPAVSEQAVKEELAQAGILLWPAEISALPDGRGARTQAAEVMESAGLAEERLYILTDCSADGAELLERLLSQLIQDRYDLRLAVETEIR